jgi:chaperonin GroEL (HSP60 family)
MDNQDVAKHLLKLAKSLTAKDMTPQDVKDSANKALNDADEAHKYFYEAKHLITAAMTKSPIIKKKNIQKAIKTLDDELTKYKNILNTRAKTGKWVN